MQFSPTREDVVFEWLYLQFGIRGGSIGVGHHNLVFSTFAAYLKTTLFGIARAR